MSRTGLPPLFGHYDGFHGSTYGCNDPLPLAIFELLEYIIHEVMDLAQYICTPLSAAPIHTFSRPTNRRTVVVDVYTGAALEGM